MMKLQDVFLNDCRREEIEVSIQLLDQTEQNGQIIGFDNQSIILETNGNQHLLYKNAIVAVNPHYIVNCIFNESHRNDVYRSADLHPSAEYTADFA